MNTGQRIREARKSQGLTLDKLAKKVGVSTAYVSQVERNESHLNSNRLKVWSKILGVNLEIEPPTKNIDRINDIIKVATHISIKFKKVESIMSLKFEIEGECLVVKMVQLVYEREDEGIFELKSAEKESQFKVSREEIIKTIEKHNL